MSNENNAGVDLDKLILVLKPFADAYAPMAQHEDPDVTQVMRAFLDRNTITPAGTTVGDYRRAYEAFDLARRASATPSSKNAGGDGKRASWNTKQWYEHVGAWETPEGFVSFGSVMAVRAMLLQFQRAMAPAAAYPTFHHPDDAAVDRFAAAMKAKMDASRAKGRSGWDNEALCPSERLQSMLIEHIAKGDPVDVGNFAMMLWSRGETTAGAVAKTEQAPTTTREDGPRLSIEQCIAQFGLYADSCDALGNIEGARQLRKCAGFLRDHGPSASAAGAGSEQAEPDGDWYSAEDGEAYTHPTYGPGVFFTEDCVRAALARAPLPAQDGQAVDDARDAALKGGSA